jgi:hypothetical protein
VVVVAAVVVVPEAVVPAEVAVPAVYPVVGARAEVLQVVEVVAAALGNPVDCQPSSWL